jgi:glucose-6-phosphate 1-dehydrogenase
MTCGTSSRPRYYIPTDFADEAASPRQLLAARRGADLAGNRAYYLAVPPAAFPTIVDALGKRRTRRLDASIVEPFGHDLESASLNTMLWDTSPEGDLPDRPLPRRDGREHARARCRDGIFEPIWNRQFIDHVQSRW